MVLGGFPLWLATAHNAGAALLLLATLALNRSPAAAIGAGNFHRIIFAATAHEPVRRPAIAAGASWRDYFELTKPRVVALIVLTAVVGTLLASPGLPPLDALIFGNLGIALSAASAAAINHVLDRRIDARMARTRKRPLPSGHLAPAQALAFALLLGVMSMVILVAFVNVLTAALTFASLIVYAVVYTVWLKRATPQNIVIGGAAGAAPPVLGWVAVTNHIDPQALLLFLIIFAWTPPHFWALAIARRHDYAKADIPMLPVTHGVEFTRLHVLLYTVMLCVVTLLPYMTGMSGLIYLAPRCCSTRASCGMRSR
jgi:protoheme IX farnesyltransferase